MFADPLTAVHSFISLAAIVAGIPVIAWLMAPGGPDRWSVPFLLLAALTTATGFLLPFAGITPAVATGIVAALILLVVVVARYGFHRAGFWRGVDALGMVISLYLLVFVLIAQLFSKVAPLHALAPTGSESAFAAAQLACLAVFAWIGYRAVRAGRRGLAA